MKYLILFSLVFCTLTIKAQNLLPKNDPAYKLVFNEDFSVDTLDNYKWMKHYNWGHFTNTNRYPTVWLNNGGCQSSAPPNDSICGFRMNDPDTSTLKIDSGICKLTIRKENRYGHVWTWPGGVFTPDSLMYKYIKSMLVSRYKFKYGYFEIRFKYPYRSTPNGNNAYTPTFWLLGIAESADTADFMQYSETDIFEINAIDNKYTATMHHRNKFQTRRKLTNIIDNDFLVTGGQWHTASGHRHPKGVDFYVDDTLRGSWVNDTAALMREQFIVIDTDSPTMNFCVPTSSGTTYPYTTEIDYVKVWQLQSACDTSKTVCNATMSTHPAPKVYQEITDGGSGCWDN